MDKFIQVRTIRSYSLQFFLILNFVVLFWLVWTPSQPHSCENTSLVAYRIFCLSPTLVWTGNFFLLIPTAVLLRILYPSFSRWFISAVAISVSSVIELVQYLIPGRDPDWRDIVVNTVGAMLVTFVPSFQTKKVKGKS